MSAAVGLTDSQSVPVSVVKSTFYKSFAPTGDKVPPPSYYEALQYPVESDENYDPVKYVDIVTEEEEEEEEEEENGVYSTFYQENLSSLSERNVLLPKDEEMPSSISADVENDSFRTPETIIPISPENTRKQFADISISVDNTRNSYSGLPCNDENSQKQYTDLEKCSENLEIDDVLSYIDKEVVSGINSETCAQNDQPTQSCDPDVVQSSTKASVEDAYEPLREPDVVHNSPVLIKSEDQSKHAYEGLELPEISEEEELDDQLSEVSKSLSDVHLRSQTSVKGYTNGYRPISGITTRSVSPEPGPSGYTGAKNKGPRKAAVITYDSRNGSCRTLPTSSSENVNSIHEMSYRFDAAEIDKQALRTGEAADRGTLYCACGILGCIIGIVIILVYIA